jgi:hypothetical protein
MGPELPLSVFDSVGFGLTPPFIAGEYGPCVCSGDSVMWLYFPVGWKIVHVVYWSFSVESIVEFMPSVVAGVADSVEIDSDFVIESRLVGTVM